MLRTINRLTVQLAANVSATDTSFKLFSSQLALLNTVPAGDHVLLDLSDGRGTETVQYTSAGPVPMVGGFGVIPVTRAVEGVALNWPTRACLSQSTSEAYFAALICRHAGDCP